MQDDSRFKIFIEQLRDGQTNEIQEILSPEFLGVHEEDLKFQKPVMIKGEAYLAGESLIIHLDVTATGIIPCLACNEPVEVEINLDNFYHMQPLNEIKGAVYIFKEILREAILLEFPAFAECNQGNCRKRAEIQKYLKNSEETTEEGYHPFANL